MAADAICGALGEIAQIVVLYPVDTLKVQCQAQGARVGDVISCLRAQNLGPLQLLRTLYAGCGSAATCSAVIGAVYLVTFFHAKRMLSRCAQAGLPLSSSGVIGKAAWDGCQGRVIFKISLCQKKWCNSSCVITYLFIGCAFMVCRAAERRAHSRHQSGAVGAAGSSPSVALAAACTSSLLTSIFESPMEMFKHRTQVCRRAARNLFCNFFHSLLGQMQMTWLLCTELVKQRAYEVFCV